MEIFTEAPMLKVLACTHPKWVQKRDEASSIKIKSLGSKGFRRPGLCGFNVIKQISSYFSCLGECRNTVLLWSSKKVLLTMKLHLTFHWHGGEKWDDMKIFMVIVAKISVFHNIK